MTAVHRSIVCVDVEGYGHRSRTDWDRLAVRRGMYAALQRAFTESGVPWNSCYYEDRGDGAMILVPPGVPKERLAARLPDALATPLVRHNCTAVTGAHIRLRVALHAGEIRYDPHGVVGSSLNLAFRLLEADPVKSALRSSPGVLALIASDWFYDEVIRQTPVCAPAAYRAVLVAVKETRTRGWLRLAGADAERPTHRPVRQLIERAWPGFGR
ncbi:hypothetical protein [Actinomadura rifamycini]|uniref:hypothetical protein n=1 Tax=Actinomadura rifamycini TaxID=31962 RepID=UPI0003FDDC17|nr:hypothetical protein [Actinomadura rifamycini]